MPSIINLDDGQISGTPAIRITAAGDGVLQIQNSGNPALEVSATGELSVVQALRTNTIKSAAGAPAISINDDGSIGTASPISTGYASWPQVSVNKPLNATGLAYNAWTEFRNGFSNPVAIAGGTFSSGRFTPNVPGLYIAYIDTPLSAASCTVYGCGIGKNGTLLRSSYQRTPALTNASNPSITAVIYLNGTTDFVSGFFFLGSSSSGTVSCNFDVYLMQKATL